MLIIASAALSLYASKPAAITTVTSTLAVTEYSTVTKNIIPRATMDAKQFLPQLGQTIHDAWLLFAPAGNGSYILTIHAEGLSPSQGTSEYYIVRGIKTDGTVEEVPVGGALNASLLHVNEYGVGDFYLVLDHDPSLAYEAVEIVRIGGSESSPAVVVATASLLPAVPG